MGFDIECIVDIYAYPGKYFCPVCRTLVYPNEAFQSQCSHLYCKPCLAHIANGSRACPYDGYLVTESDSKPLMVSDRALAENIGKVKVHCLYFRSGCTWEGCLSDCTSHCSECSFGNSHVICNKCGIQVVHRQSLDHTLSCLGIFEGQGQHVVAKSGTTSSTTTVAQSGAVQVHNPQNVSVAPSVQSNAIAQVPVVAPPVAVDAPTPEQWYDPYLHYYHPLHQQPFQQYQQHPWPVQGQNQPHFLQSQPPPQPNPVSQTVQQPNIQSQAQVQVQPQMQPQMQVPPRGPALVHDPNQAIASNFQVNQQQPILQCGHHNRLFHPPSSLQVTTNLCSHGHSPRQ